MDDATSNTFDSSFVFSVTTADTLAAELVLNGSALYPYSDAGLDLGKSGTEFNDLYLDGTANIDALVADTADINGGTLAAVSTDGTFTFGDEEVWTSEAIALTSPTTTFDVDGHRLITLSTDENQTGCYPTGGDLNQIVTIVPLGTGSNTMQFDDGTSMSIGANHTITEGQHDSLTLRCLSADGDEWAEVAFADN